MMKRLFFLIALVAIVSAAFYLDAGRKSDVTVLNARAVAIGGRADTFVVTFEIQNQGPAKTLTNIQTAFADHVHVMNPGYEDAAIVIPANSTGIFAMDGAHVMLMGADADFVEGSSIPLTITFDGYGEITTRFLRTGNEATMDHDMTNGIQSLPSPSVVLNAPDGFDADGTEIAVSVDNFSFVRVEEDAPHVPMEGHAHIYLNGLKLGRLYDGEFNLGGLSSGSYELKVTLNANNHQAYMLGDAPVFDVLKFQVN